MSINRGIYFACSNCNQHIDAEPGMAGSVVPCPNCQQQLEIPTETPLADQGPRSSLLQRLIAGGIGGFILAVLAGNIISLLLGDITAKEQDSVAKVIPTSIALGLWFGTIVVAIRSRMAARVWRRLLITCACLSFALPVAVFVSSAKAAHQMSESGSQAGAIAAVGVGGVVMILTGILGFFMGAIMLTIGLLVGRNKPQQAKS